MEWVFFVLWQTSWKNAMTIEVKLLLVQGRGEHWSYACEHCTNPGERLNQIYCHYSMLIPLRAVRNRDGPGASIDRRLVTMSRGNRIC